MSKIVIIGNGIAGITAARSIRKRSDDQIVVISGESEYFYSRTALMYVYMGHMGFEQLKPYENHFWKKNRIELLKAWVTEIDFDNKKLITDKETIVYDKLILALGSKPNKFGWPGQDLEGVSGLYSLQDLDNVEKSTQGISNAVIVGGGLIGIELAEMLHARNISVDFLVREDSFWNNVLPPEESKIINQEILDHGINLQLSTELSEISDGGDGRVASAITSKGEKIDCQFVGLTAGVSAQLELLKGTNIELDRGVLVDEYLQTNIDDVYAIGDCAQLRKPSKNRRPMEQVWYVGRMMGETVARTLTGDKTKYQPGVWFNSAKFFNLEYQTYGIVNASPLDGEESFLWQSHCGKKMVRVVFSEKDTRVLGLNTIGIRMRHEIWNEWIEKGVNILTVIRDLEKANFDPEFFKRYEYEIREAFNKQFDYMKVENKKSTFFKRLIK